MVRVKLFLQILNFFRILFPSWKFFDQVGVQPKLWYQLESETEIWKPALSRPDFSLKNIFFNPEGNLHHACQSLVERLLTDIQDLEADFIESSVSYQLVEQLVRFQILQSDPTAQGQRFQFRISISYPGQGDALISGKHEA